MLVHGDSRYPLEKGGGRSWRKVVVVFEWRARVQRNIRRLIDSTLPFLRI